MKLVLALISIFLAGCAAGNYPNVYDRLRDVSLNDAVDKAKDMEAFLAGNTEDQAIAKAKDAVLRGLKDPESARFQNVNIKRYSAGPVVCGEVNAKNAYGGYVGFTPFVASTTDATLYDQRSDATIRTLSNAGIFAACGY